MAFAYKTKVNFLDKVCFFWVGHKIWKIFVVILTRASCSVCATVYLSKSQRRFFKTNLVNSYYTNFNWINDALFSLYVNNLCFNFFLWKIKISYNSLSDQRAGVFVQLSGWPRQFPDVCECMCNKVPRIFFYLFYKVKLLCMPKK